MNSVKSKLKYFVQMLLRNFMRILFLFPIKEGAILFSSFWGDQMADNPKYIYEFLLDQDLEKFKYIWVYNSNIKNIEWPKSVKVVKKRSFKWFYYMVTAQVIVDNYPPSFIVPHKKNQFYIETWHAGGAYKKIGDAYKGKNDIEKKSTDISMRAVKIFVSSSKRFTQTNIEEGYHYTGEILNCGMPRNDIFFCVQKIKEAADNVKKYYSLKGKIVLYAPTFRGETNQTEEIKDIIDIKRLREAVKKRYGVDVDIIVRCHYLDKYNYFFGDNIIDACNYPNMQELLCAADILITDYSSSMWDYSFLGRPCLFYTPDIDLYIKNRGFFIPPENWPGIICRSMDELCNEIKNLNEENCALRAKSHLELMGSYENGHATETIANMIINYTNGKR